jgi:hypothetical protein
MWGEREQAPGLRNSFMGSPLFPRGSAVLVLRSDSDEMPGTALLAGPRQSMARMLQEVMLSASPCAGRSMRQATSPMTRWRPVQPPSCPRVVAAQAAYRQRPPPNGSQKPPDPSLHQAGQRLEGGAPPPDAAGESTKRHPHPPRPMAPGGLRLTRALHRRAESRLRSTPEPLRLSAKSGRTLSRATRSPPSSTAASRAWGRIHRARHPA